MSGRLRLTGRNYKLTTHDSRFTTKYQLENQPQHTKHTPLVKPKLGNTIPILNGLVLSGGESSRMGKDKSSMDYHGMPQHDYLFQLLSDFVSEAYISCHPERLPKTGNPILKDTFLDLGPYSGVLSAFRFNPNVAWLTIACDMPLLNETIIKQLVSERDPSKVATCFHDPSTGFPEPLLTIWEPKAYPLLLQFLSQGISCLRKSLINTDSKQLDALHPELLKNANTPEEAEMMRKELHDDNVVM